MAMAFVFITLIILILFASFYILSQLRLRLERAKSESEFLRQDKEKFEEKVNVLQRQNIDFEKQNELLKQAKSQLEEQQKDWEKNKDLMLLKLSEELIKKNSEQQNQISLNQQETLKKITENLFKNFENVTAKITSLNDEVKKSSDLTNLTRQALLSPGAAGRTAEITLENILKNSGLRQKDDLNSSGDYILQSHFSSFNYESQQESKRPDAIIFFPGDQIAIIDSKSSPHFLELETARQNNDLVQEKIILGKIKEAFRKHLESLRKKDYAKFLFEELRSKNSDDCKILIIMFLQTEKMLEILRETDADFEQKALQNGVIIATPIGLINFLSQARIVIDRIKQEKNIEDLKISVRRLLDNIAVVFKESKELGKALNKASSMQNKMVKTLNRGIYSAVKNISDLGIEGKKSVEITLLEESELKEEEEN